MAFTSFNFLVFVLAVVCLYYVIPKSYRWCVLLAASYAFYLISSANTFVFVLLTTCTTFFGGKALGKINAEHKAYLAEHKETMSRDDKKELKANVQKKKRTPCMKQNVGQTISERNFLCLPDQAVQHERERRQRCKKSDGSGGETADNVLPGKEQIRIFTDIGSIIPIHLETIAETWGKNGNDENKSNQFELIFFEKFFDGRVLHKPSFREIERYCR